MNEPSSQCPICKQKTQKEFRPFCSRKCADIDLGRWFSEKYHISSPLADKDQDKEFYDFAKERLDPDHNVG